MWADFNHYKCLKFQYCQFIGDHDPRQLLNPQKLLLLATVNYSIHPHPAKNTITSTTSQTFRDELNYCTHK